MFLGCEQPPPPAIDEVDWAAASGQAVVRLEAGALSLDGQLIGDLRQPGVLRASRHRRLLKALKIRSGQDPDSSDPPEHALLSEGRTATVRVSADTPWEDLYPVLATAAWAGFGPFSLAILDQGASAPVGPLSVDARQPAAWGGEPILGPAPWLDVHLEPDRAWGLLGFHAWIAPEQGERERRQLPQHLRSMGSEPLVDCQQLFGDAPALAAICHEGARPVAERYLEPSEPPWPAGLPAGQRALQAGGPSGCLVAPPDSPDAQPAWGSELAGSLRALELDRDVHLGLVPGQAVPARTLLQVLAAFGEAGLELPVLSLTKPRERAAASCDGAKIVAAVGVQTAGARWLGEHRLPPR